MAHPLTRLDHGPLRIIARHPSLVDFAGALLAGLQLPGAPPLAWRAEPGPVTIHLGLRDLFKVVPPRRGLSIGIQTEQFYDHEGRALWGREARWRLLKYAACYDAILDLSAANRPHYDALPARYRRRITFGPFVFPRRVVAYRPEPEPARRTVFFGTLNERRRRLMAGLKTAPALVPPGTYGVALEAAVAAESAVLNLHFDDGVYAEYPRLLAAYLAGKPVMTEPLGPLVGSECVLPLGDVPDEATSRAVFARFGESVAMRYRFVDFLVRLGVCEADPLPDRL